MVRVEFQPKKSANLDGVAGDPCAEAIREKKFGMKIIIHWKK